MLRDLFRHLNRRTAVFCCPVCGGVEYLDARPYRSRSQGTCFSNRELVMCANCSTRSAHPMPTKAQLRKYYKTYSLSENRAEQLPFLDAQARARLAFFSDLLQKDRAANVLDVGAGYGCIAAHLATLVPQLAYEAIEWDADSVAYLRSNHNVRRVLTDLAESRRQYDLVILSHFLEHLPQPASYIHRLRNHLHAGSLIFVELPNQDFRYKDSNEPHLIFFSPSTIHALLAREGFKVLKSDTFGVPTSELEAFWGNLSSRKEEIRRVEKVDSEESKRMLRQFYDERKQQLERMGEHLGSAGPDRQWIRLVASPA